MGGRGGFANRLFARGLRIAGGRSGDDHRISLSTNG
jgi:hypothetical protein